MNCFEFKSKKRNELKSEFCITPFESTSLGLSMGQWCQDAYLVTSKEEKVKCPALKKALKLLKRA
jgi:hypothetical protein